MRGLRRDALRAALWKVVRERAGRGEAHAELRADGRPKTEAARSPPRQATALPVHGLLEGAAPPAPSPVVTPPVPGARDAAVARAAAAAPRGTVVVNGEPRGAGAPPPKPKPKPKAPAPKPKARPKKRVKRESPPPAPVEEAEPLPPAPADDEVQEGAALAPRAFREKLSKALDKLGGRYNLEASPGVRGNLQPAVQVRASGQRDAHYGAVWSPV